MLKAGIIRSCNSPYNAQAVVVDKKESGKVRICLQAKPINAKLETPRFPIKRIQRILDNLGGATVFSTLDLTRAYWQVKLSKESQEATAFELLDAQYCYQRMPYGLCNAPAIFAELMYKVLDGLPFATSYLDDILVFSKTFEEHLVHLAHVFHRLQQHNLTLP